jgi:AMMECR1 domain-containing protein
VIIATTRETIRDDIWRTLLTNFNDDKDRDHFYSRPNWSLRGQIGVYAAKLESTRPNWSLRGISGIYATDMILARGQIHASNIYHVI